MLVNRNITVGGQRTSIRLEPEFWAALSFIAERESVSVDELCTEIDSGAGKLSRTAAVRVFIASYAVQLSQRTDAQPERQFVGDVSGWSDTENVNEYPVAFQRLRAVG